MKRYLCIAAFILFGINPVLGVVFTEGHGGLGLGENDELELHLHLHEGAVVDGATLLEDAEYQPDEAIITVPNLTLFARPEGAVWDFIGNSAGEDTWELPATHTSGVPYFGISAEEVTLGAFADNEITLTLTNVDGPGDFSVYTVSLGIPTVYMASRDGITDNDAVVLDLILSNHAHYNFAFSEAGLYAVTFEVSAIKAGTGELVADEATFTFHVIPEPATICLLAMGTIGLLRKR